MTTEDDGRHTPPTTTASSGLSFLMASYSLPSSPESSPLADGTLFHEDMFEMYDGATIATDSVERKTHGHHRMYGSSEEGRESDGLIRANLEEVELSTVAIETPVTDTMETPEAVHYPIDGDKENVGEGGMNRWVDGENKDTSNKPPLLLSDIVSSLDSKSKSSGGFSRHHSNLSLTSSVTTTGGVTVKDELIEYTDGEGNYFYVSPDGIEQELDRSDSPTFLPEQEFLTLDSRLKTGSIWNKDDSTFSEVLHNVGLIRKDAAKIISEASTIQRSKLNLLLNTWSNQKAFTDCLAEMTDCDNYFSPIGYNTVLVTDPCMSARYDCLSTGLNQQEVERKQRDEFYNFTEEKSFAYEQCKLCHKMFSNRFGLRQHIAHMHPTTNPEELLRKEGLYSCLRCKKPFNSQAQLKKHFKKVHIPKSNDDLNFKCSHCGEHFKTRVLLHRHVLDKHRNRSKAEAAELHEPWSCELCKNVFYKKSNFIKHMQKIHGKIKVSERLLNSAKVSAQLAASHRHHSGKETRSSTSSPKATRTTREPTREPRERRSRSSRKLELKMVEPASTESDTDQPIPKPVPQESSSSSGTSLSNTSSPPLPSSPAPLTPLPDEEEPEEQSGLKRETVNVTCLFCKLCFISYNDLQLHCTEVHKEGNKIILLKMFSIIASQAHGINYQCILCTKISTTAPIALTHLQTAHLTDVGQVKGQISAEFSPPLPTPPSISDYDFMSLTCKFCNKTFKNSKIKRKHEKTIHNDQSIVCYFCFIPISNRTELTKHIKSDHSGTKCLFKCRWCNEHFTSIPKRCDHMRTAHSVNAASAKNNTKSTVRTVVPAEDKPGRGGFTNSTERQSDSGAAPSTWCSKCRMDFPNLEHKSKHDRLIHNEDQKYYCLYCFASYEVRGILIHHIAHYHSGKKMYKCKWCEIQFDTLYQRCVHLKEIHGISPATIDRDISRERCLSEDDVPSIMNKSPSTTCPSVSPCRDVTSPKPLSPTSSAMTSSGGTKGPPLLVRNCLLCGAEVTSMLLKKHLVEHRQRDYFCCIFCDKTVPSIGGMKSHILRNHPFITSKKLQTSEFKSDEARRVATIEKHHQKDPGRRTSAISTHEPPAPRISRDLEIIYPCQSCMVILPLKEHVEEHWKQHSREEEKQWTCTLCDEQYTEFTTFRFHNDLHMSDPYAFAQSTIELQNICRVCNIAIETKQALHGHILIHRTVENFLCIFCKARSFTFRTMIEHINQNHLNTKALMDDPSRHLNETPFNSSTFLCCVCLKLCNNQFNLNSHTKAHILGGKPCSLCKFKFRDMLSLVGHLKEIHHASKEYVGAMTARNISRADAVSDYCELCNTTFTSQGRYQKHRRLCKDAFRLNHAGETNNSMMALLDGPGVSTPSPRQPRSSGARGTVSTTTPSSERDTSYDDDSGHESGFDNNEDSSDSDPPPPMEIPMKSQGVAGPEGAEEGNLFGLSASPHTYNTRKRCRPESYTNIVPVKMLPFTYTDKATSSSSDNVEEGEEEDGLSAEPLDPPPTSLPPLEPSTLLEPQPTRPKDSTPYCDICDLEFVTVKQLSWHKHTKRHLEMELMAKGVDLSSSGKHSCDMCTVGYNCKKQLVWHKKIVHGEGGGKGMTESEKTSENGGKKNDEGGKRKSEGGMVVKSFDDGAKVRGERPIKKLILDDSENPEVVTPVRKTPQKLADDGASRVALDDEPPLKPHILMKEEDEKKTQPQTEISPYPLSQTSIRMDAVMGHSQQDGIRTESPGVIPSILKESPKTPLIVRPPDQFDASIHSAFYCHLCQIDYKTNKQLYNHKRTLGHIQLAKKFDPQFNDTEYTCKECNITFESYKQLWNHRKTFDHRKIMESPVVPTPLTPEEDATRPGTTSPSPEEPPGSGNSISGTEFTPREREVDVTSYVCLDCECVFENRNQMRWHSRRFKHKTISIDPPAPAARLSPSHDGTASPAPLDTTMDSGGGVCDAQGAGVIPLRTDNFPYYCQQCQLPFRAFRSYSIHCKQHLKEGFKCMICNQKFQFRNYNNVKRHIARIHKIQTGRAKKYLRTFHDYDAHPEPLIRVDPVDLASQDKSHHGHITTAIHTSSSSTSSDLLEKLLEDAGLSLELVEQFTVWHRPTRCRFCPVEFVKVPDLLIHIHDEHDKNFHRYFLTKITSGRDSSDDSNLEGSVELSEDEEESHSSPLGSVPIKIYKRKGASITAGMDSRKGDGGGKKPKLRMRPGGADITKN